jgi:hypothetical protein
VQERISLSNQIRGLLAEYGITMTKSIHNLTKCLPIILADEETELSTLSKTVFSDLCEQIILKTKKLKNRTIWSILTHNTDYKVIAA